MNTGALENRCGRVRMNVVQNSGSPTSCSSARYSASRSSVMQRHSWFRRSETDRASCMAEGVDGGSTGSSSAYPFYAILVSGTSARGPRAPSHGADAPDLKLRKPENGRCRHLSFYLKRIESHYDCVLLWFHRIATAHFASLDCLHSCMISVAMTSIRARPL